jgi:hypothetical protein
VQITFTPVDTNFSQATLTLADNAAIPSQTLSLSGTGGLPQVSYPPAFKADDLLVGTNATFNLALLNSGTANWIINSIGASGDFSVSDICSTMPVPPTGFCVLRITFAPTQPGVRTGTLTITDNVAGSPHTIALSGTGLATYPVPTITSVSAAPNDQPDRALRIMGTNFFPASQVIVNGSPRLTHYGNETGLLVQLTVGDLSNAGELPVTVTNPLPGGGLSNTSVITIYDALRNLGTLHTVYDPQSGFLYSCTSTSATTNAGKVLVIDPAAAKVVNVWSVGNGPNQLAVSDDGQFLYVGLDGDKKVAQVALPAGTVNFTVGLGNDPDFNNPMVADAIRAHPGLAHSWAVTLCGVGFTPCGEGVAVFDDAVQRATRVFQNQVQPDGLLFIGTNATTLYGTTFFQGPSTFYEFSISSAGITETQAITNFAGESPGGAALDSDGKSIYVANGQVIDPSTLTISGHIQAIPGQSGMRVDAPASRVYFAGQPSGFNNLLDGLVIDAFDLSSQQMEGSVPLPEMFELPEVFRWSNNGLAISSMNALLLLRTSLTGTPASGTQLAVTGWSPATVPAGTSDLALTIGGTQFASGDSLTANGSALPITVVNSITITTTIPASMLAQPGNIQIVVSNPANQHASFMFTIMAGPPPVAAVSPNTLTFSAQLVTTKSSAQNVTIQNNGSTTLVVSSVVINGDFSQTDSCTSIAPSMKCLIAVVFTPTAVGSRTGTLTINDNDASKSQTVMLNGTATDIQISGSGGSGTSATVISGQPATYNLSVQGEGGLMGTVTFSCSSLPQFAACSASPPSTNLGGSAVSVVLTISTKQTQAAIIPRPREMARAGMLWLGIILLAACAGWKAPRGRTIPQTALGLFALLLIFLPLMGCGGSGSGGQPQTMTTPKGTYMVNFIATTAAGSRSAPLTLRVQ